MSPAGDALERHRPVLRYDRQYDFRVLPAETIVDNSGNLLRRSDGDVIARAGGKPPLTLATLSAYPAGLRPKAEDCLCEAPDYLGDARRMERDGRYSSLVYGRTVEDGDRTWLQYWFWLYYNPKNLLGFGKHEGDWEMVQVGLASDGTPELATYAQHDSGEARGWDEVEALERDGGLHPVVYVSPLSHASYFEPGTHPYPVGIDHPYGDGPEELPPLAPLGDWAGWVGRWGNTERAVLRRRVGNGPPSPGRQGSKWRSPAAFHTQTRRRLARRALGRLLHRVGRATYPLPPAVEARLDGDRVRVDYDVRQTRLRRTRHLYVTAHEGERVLASRIALCAGGRGSEDLVLPHRPEGGEVWVSAFNRLRQRSDLVRAGL